MNRQLWLDYIFLIILVIVFVILPYKYANEQLERLQAFDSQLRAEREELNRQKEAFLAEKRNREKTCLATNIYHEARGENERGKQAVAQVTLNRTQNENFPSDICGVVYQGCQFSWYCDGKSDEIFDEKAWADSLRVANDALEGRTSQSVGSNVVYYHSNRVKPRWARTKKFIASIGKHLFYAEKS